MASGQSLATQGTHTTRIAKSFNAVTSYDSSNPGTTTTSHPTTDTTIPDAATNADDFATEDVTWSMRTMSTIANGLKLLCVLPIGLFLTCMYSVFVLVFAIVRILPGRNKFGQER
ncbi:hypothetical protein PYCC9005_004645 [Savitreella phatthalungensis]